MTTTKKDLITHIYSNNDIHPSDVQLIIQAFLDKILETLGKGQRLEFRDFVVFEIVRRKQKIGRNLKNSSTPIIIPAHFAVKFTAGKEMKNRLVDMKSHLKLF
ncbi:Integration host factor subunit beta (plasmid) [Candidatus Protochlamydia naegleriophila]|uniref:Integration host factor subunit beta n=1 Tax=Candidatus Protochlamydia naegleriophila TaxID=389348 RepID=A0A0U5JEW9_9BACT|nr:HU family DNA-binding protein [Candidatus Protochlamydia naegleriophila]CUI18062.1 Integration host factor subunit beta [Candidatus Protochlamydia naegleriophila]